LRSKGYSRDGGLAGLWRDYGLLVAYRGQKIGACCWKRFRAVIGSPWRFDFTLFPEPFPLAAGVIAGCRPLLRSENAVVTSWIYIRKCLAARSRDLLSHPPLSSESVAFSGQRAIIARAWRAVSLGRKLPYVFVAGFGIVGILIRFSIVRRVQVYGPKNRPPFFFQHTFRTSGLFILSRGVFWSI